MAPLRNYKASIKVIDCVAQLLSLPLAIGFPEKDMLDIQSVSTRSGKSIFDIWLD